MLASTRAQSRATPAALLALGIVLSLLASAAPSAADGGPHVMGTGLTPDTCALCHRVHDAKAPFLLKESEESLCYSCHGSAAGGSDLDVVDGVGYAGANTGGASREGPPLPLRGGGFKYTLINPAESSGQQTGGSDPEGVVGTLSAGAPVTSAHSVNSSSQMDWGNGPISATVNYGKMISLRCGSCHDPHGNGMYRTLRPIPEESGASEPVRIPESAEKEYTTENYWDVEEKYDPNFLKEISAWCATCHTRYLTTTSYTESGDAIFTDRHLSDGIEQGAPSCIQCHVAHGTDAVAEEAASMGIHSPEPVPAPADSRLLRIDAKGTCLMCHAGETDPRGPTGETGTTGATGETGTSGETATAGAAGKAGETAGTGGTGATGVRGTSGASGASGT